MRMVSISPFEEDYPNNTIWISQHQGITKLDERFQKDLFEITFFSKTEEEIETLASYQTKYWALDHEANSLDDLKDLDLIPVLNISLPRKSDGCFDLEIDTEIMKDTIGEGKKFLISSDGYLHGLFAREGNKSLVKVPNVIVSHETKIFKFKENPVNGICIGSKKGEFFFKSLKNIKNIKDKDDIEYSEVDYISDDKLIGLFKSLGPKKSGPGQAKYIFSKTEKDKITNVLNDFEKKYLWTDERISRIKSIFIDDSYENTKK